MEKKDAVKEKLLLYGLPALLSILLFLIPALLRPPLFCLNDDLQLRDILSGSYAGAGVEVHSVYMRVPLSFLLSVLYHLIPGLPWFGLFLCGSIVFCFYLLLHSVIRRAMEAEGVWQACVGILLLLGLYLLYFRSVFIMPHYTLVAAVCGAAGLWLLLGDLPSGKIFAPLLFLLCDQIRSQVFLMFVPFIALAFVLCVLTQKEERKELLRAAAAFFLLFAGLFAVHKAAYMGEEWQEYLRLNEARTQLYDYAGVWDREEAKEWYVQQGVEAEAFPLYLNYDLLPDDTADARKLMTIAKWPEQAEKESGFTHFKKVLYDLRTRSLSTEERVYFVPILITFVLGAVVLLIRKKGLSFAALCGALLLHFGLYGLLLWRGRAPERVTVSLYLGTTLFMAGLLMREKLRLKEACAVLIPVLSVLIAAGMIRPAVTYDTQIAVNQSDDVIYSYMAEHPQDLFLLETYATVYRTGFVFEDARRPDNVLLMGGWQYGSPLMERVIAEYGYADRNALFTKAGVCLVFREGDGLTPEELQAFLDERFGERLQLKEEERLEAEGAAFCIYRLTE